MGTKPGPLSQQYRERQDGPRRRIAKAGREDLERLGATPAEHRWDCSKRDQQGPEQDCERSPQDNPAGSCSREAKEVQLRG